MCTLKIDFKDMTIYLFGAITLVLFIFLAYYCDSKKDPKIRKRVEELYLNGKFAIGTVSGTGYTVLSGGGMIRNGISYGFDVSISTKTPNGYQSGNLSYGLAKQISKKTFVIYKKIEADVKRKDKFLVLYDGNNPKNAILLLCHSINSESDFARYVAEIEELRKNKDWRGFK